MKVKIKIYRFDSFFVFSPFYTSQLSRVKNRLQDSLECVVERKLSFCSSGITDSIQYKFNFLFNTKIEIS